jgi:hypothetical protein
VAREHDGRARSGRVDDNPVEQVAAFGVESRVRLVEQPELGSTLHESGQGHPAPLTGRQPSDGDVVQSFMHAHAVEGGERVDHPTLPGPTPEPQVLDDGQLVVETTGMAEQADRVAHRTTVAA